MTEAMTTQCFSEQCQASPLVVQFYYTRCCQCYRGGWLMSELYALTAPCDFHKPGSTRVSAAVTSFNHRLVHILSGRACPTAVRIKERLVVVSQVNLYWALEICGAQRGKKKKKKTHACRECCFNSSPCFGAFIPFISCLVFFSLHLLLHHPGLRGSHISFSFLSPPLPPFHFSFLASCLYRSPVLRFYVSAP